MKENLNTSMDKRVKKAFDALTPDVLDAVLSCCDREKGKILTMKKKQFNYKKAMIASAACFALLFGCFAAYTSLSDPPSKNDPAIAPPTQADTVTTIVTLDVNPSIEIQADQNEKVISVAALNKDAQIVVGNVDFVGTKLEQTVDALVDTMIEKGYINESTNSVLLSVNNLDEAKGNTIKDKLANGIANLIENDTVKGSVISQVISTEDEALSELAKHYGITIGKAKFIRYILAGDKDANFANYVDYSITELNKLLKDSSQKEDPDYIGEEAALQIALESLGLTLEELDEKPTIEIVVQRGEVCYMIRFTITHYVDEFNYSTSTMHCYVNAVTGKCPGADVTEPNITKEEALAIVLAGAGFSENEISDLECRFNDMESGMPMTYTVYFEKNNRGYCGLVDAMDGTLIRIEQYNK